MVRLFHFLVGLVCIFLTAQTVHAQNVKHPRGTTASPYGYLEHLPPGYESSNELFPVILFWHGYGEKGDGSASQLDRVKRHGPPALIENGSWQNVSNNIPFIVISPQNSNGFASPALNDDMIDYIIEHYKADPNRIYMTGLSAGGMSVWNYINQYQDKVAAVVPIAGNGNATRDNACSYSHIPVWAFHGDADGTVYPGGSINPVNSINNCNPVERARVTIYNGVGHDSWSRTYNLSGMNNYSDQYDPYNENIYEWMMAHSLNSSNAPQEPAPNNAPVANAGNDKWMTLPLNTINISGSGTDSDGSVTAYNWTKISGGNITLTNSSQPELVVQNFAAGTYELRLTVTDNDGSSSSDNMTLHIYEGANEAPVANAGADKWVTLPLSSVKIAGSSYDADGSVTKYKWTKVSGGNITLSNETSSELTVQNFVAGAYTLRLTVTDNDGATHSDDMTLNVAAAPNVVENKAPWIDRIDDIQVRLPQSEVSVTASAHDYDNGYITSYVWTQRNGDPLTLVNANTQTLTLRNLKEGVYRFRLTVYDNDGAYSLRHFELAVAGNGSTFDEIVPNRPPWIDAISDTYLSLPLNSVTIHTNSHDYDDGEIVSYSWEQKRGDESVVMTGINSPTLTVSNLKEGFYRFRIKATDNEGAYSIRDAEIYVSSSSSSARVSMTEVTEEVENAEFSVASYPNPVRDILTMSTTKACRYKLVDLNGMEQKVGELVENETVQLDLNNLSPGIYVLLAENGEERITKKIMLSK
ncbi:PKD domain-containing protein [Fulvivirga ligni]|uniref:PKD domain-containing protein n=1 Tax=Fulvivirga ligni TaxID=2904246 RepID=UPI001F1FFB4D|nr:PKD domain-containing protein [Fulvivirga ligni]UII19712.1 PKD domain-containing protein [Fulvivirga ligni]